jgi:acyl-CoA thioester hydrolase
LNRQPIFKAPIDVRFNDIDAMGHVNNAIIFTYFEEGRKVLFYEALKSSVPGGFNFMIAHLACDYIRPIRLEDRLMLEMSVTAIGTKSFSLAYALLDRSDENRIFAKGSSVQVCYDYRQRQSIPVPQSLKKALSAYHLPT